LPPEPTSPPLPVLADVERAAARIAGEAVLTPLLTNPILDRLSGGRVYLKCEMLQRTGSFKFRGAYNALAALDPAVRERGIVAASSGNHAQAVAEAARLFGVAATIVMPADAPSAKRMRTERSGGRVVAYERGSEDREAIAARLVAESGGTMVHPFNDAQVIAGQGTVGLELAAQMAAAGATPDVVLVPCSGGGLSAGVALAVRARFPEAEVYAVEPAGFDDYRRSLAAGTILANPRASGSICDGLLAEAPGAIGFALNRRNLAGALAVADAAALAAVAFAFRELKLVAEPSGAAGLAAILDGALGVAGRTVAVVLSGGNIDAAMMAAALAA
jgi:threonine dehydratase